MTRASFGAVSWARVRHSTAATSRPLLPPGRPRCAARHGDRGARVQPDEPAGRRQLRPAGRPARPAAHRAARRHRRRADPHPLGLRLQRGPERGAHVRPEQPVLEGRDPEADLRDQPPLDRAEHGRRRAALQRGVPELAGPRQPQPAPVRGRPAEGARLVPRPQHRPDDDANTGYEQAVGQADADRIARFQSNPNYDPAASEDPAAAAARGGRRQHRGPRA